MPTEDYINHNYNDARDFPSKPKPHAEETCVASDCPDHPTKEPQRECIRCDWKGLESETVHPKHSPEDKLCPKCYEVTEVVPTPSQPAGARELAEQIVSDVFPSMGAAGVPKATLSRVTLRLKTWLAQQTAAKDANRTDKLCVELKDLACRAKEANDDAYREIEQRAVAAERERDSLREDKSQLNIELAKAHARAEAWKNAALKAGKETQQHE